MGNLVPGLVCIKQHRTQAANVEFLDASDWNMTEALELLKNMQFHDDHCSIQACIKKRLSDSDLKAMINCTNLIIGPTTYALLQKVVIVGRSFSLLKKY